MYDKNIKSYDSEDDERTNITCTGESLSHKSTSIRSLFKSRFVIFCALYVSTGGLLFGYDQGVISIVLVMPHFLKEFPELAIAKSSMYHGVPYPEESGPHSDFYKGLMTALIELGAFIGALNQGWIADKFSRKYSISCAVLFFSIGTIIQTVALNYSSLSTGRFIGGIGVGMLSMSAPLYMAEISPPEIRGVLLVLEELSIVTGIVVAFWITYGTRFIDSTWSFRFPFLIQIIPGLILGFGVFFLPFSPRWLAFKGHDEKCLRSLCKLRQLPESDPIIQKEWIEIRAEAKFQQQTNEIRHPKLKDGRLFTTIKLEIVSWFDLFKKGCWRRTIVGIGVMFFQQFVGINALIYYSPTLFKTLGLDYDMQLLMSGILNVTQLVGVFTSIYTMDRLGRRPLLLIGSILMFISHLSIAIIVGLYGHNWSIYKIQCWIGVSFLLFYMLSFGATWGPVPWALPAEIFPSSLRAKGVAVSTCSNWLNNFIIGLITVPLVEKTNYGAYIFFSAFCLLSAIFTWFFIPETNRRTLEEMDIVFHDNYGFNDEERRKEIEKELFMKQKYLSKD
ncbi:hypothetical protein PNEG_00943 [Pneumocystis murina B123]|uniref:Major facilitator superfamily (MFS) profile domain-containing protein n=1 Tax=Pneumocystis murina (strain B123) TaxID=1069680 RepID=M7PAD6_PNEMU|nr:hypothetical protein PNEG_00943 [Pneumocystis murina B123]EMR10795.1 hypothetical protein PNEG_00943 [Pneumocystis murina B123]